MNRVHLPIGWETIYDDLPDKEPDEKSVCVDFDFKEDLLTVRNETLGLILDVGWYPEGNYSEGCFKLVLLEGEFPENRLLWQFTSRSTKEIIRILEEVARKISEEGRLPSGKNP